MSSIMSIRKEGLCLAAACALAALPVPALADETAAETGTLTISYDNDGISMDGAEITVTKVADAELEDGTVYYTLISELSDYCLVSHGRETYFDDMTAAASNATAKAWAGLGLEPEYTVTTDENGMAYISDMELGMYLVVQTGADGTSADYEYFSPFLISVPYAFDGEYVMDVVAYPKTESEKTAEETTTAAEEETTTGAESEVPTTTAAGDETPTTTAGDNETPTTTGAESEVPATTTTGAEGEVPAATTTGAESEVPTTTTTDTTSNNPEETTTGAESEVPTTTGAESEVPTTDTPNDLIAGIGNGSFVRGVAILSVAGLALIGCITAGVLYFKKRAR